MPTTCQPTRKITKILSEKNRPSFPIMTNSPADSNKKRSFGGAKKGEVKEKSNIPSNHKEQKQLRLERKRIKRGDSTDIEEAKALWEKLRPNNISAADKEKYLPQLMKLMEGKVADFIFKHDASRIVQAALKIGSGAERESIGKELLPFILPLSKSTYGKFIALKLFKYCPKLRSKMIESFYGHVVKCLKHKECSAVIEEAYALYANATQRSAFIEEFYGAEYAIFKVSFCVGFENIRK